MVCSSPVGYGVQLTFRALAEQKNAPTKSSNLPISNLADKKIALQRHRK